MKKQQFSFKVPKTVGEEATKIAIGLGYRHIDCAYIYGNEVQIGQAIRAKIADRTVKREELFYTGKLWCTFVAPKLVRKGLEKSLNDLQLDYLDLFILHWPFSLKPTGAERHTDSNKGFVYDNVNFLSTWEALEACKDAGLVKSIGVSNFNHRQQALQFYTLYKTYCTMYFCILFPFCMYPWCCRNFDSQYHQNSRALNFALTRYVSTTSPSITYY
uniref:NADP-dependent oxidoreductase domain-containing protein n=1 Tax=Leptobrachium leishanense TaxID=445787 RepID=A0A8C5QP19_9ANUR